MTGVAGYLDKMRFSEANKDDSGDEDPDLINKTP
jgi:hypothetical protein